MLRTGEILIKFSELTLPAFNFHPNGRIARIICHPNLYLPPMSLISPQLKAILVCPTCHGDLDEDEAKSVLRCQKDGTEFPVRDGIPIMMVTEEAEAAAPDAA